MKWITREQQSRSRCLSVAHQPLYRSNPRIHHVPADQVLAAAEQREATPYDVAGVELGHQGPFCSFDATAQVRAGGQRSAFDRVAHVRGRIPPL
jgi:hypothetical protein